MMFEFMHNLVVPEILSMSDLKNSEEYPMPYALYASGFRPCDEDVVRCTEEELGYSLPTQLRQYFLECGVGQFASKNREMSLSDNNSLIPTHIPKLINRTCGWMMPYTQIKPGTLPFFERDVDLFICLKPHSDNPNAVWWMWGDWRPNQGKICDSLVEFFERLVQDPDWFSHAPQ